MRGKERKHKKRSYWCTWLCICTTKWNNLKFGQWIILKDMLSLFTSWLPVLAPAHVSASSSLCLHPEQILGPCWHPHGLSVQEECNGSVGTYLLGMLLQFHFYFLPKLWDQIFLILIWLSNNYLASLVNCAYLKIKPPQQLLPSAQPCICHWFVIDATRAENRLFSFGTSLLLFLSVLK